MNRKTYSHTVAVPDEIYYKLDSEGRILVGTRDYYGGPTIHKAEWHNRYPNFDIEEVACRGTGELEIAKRLMDALQEFRNEHGPLIITSAYRTRRHNDSIKGSAPNSTHIMGIAFDSSCHNHSPILIRDFFKARGFNGFKYYKDENFVHCDMGLPFEEGFENAPDSKYSPEGKTPNQKKNERKAISGAAIIGAAPSVINSVSGLDLPSWFIMGAIVVGAAVAGIIYWKTRE